MFSTTPASSPPSTTRPQLILPIAHLEEGEIDQHAAPTVGADATAVKQALCVCASARLCVYASSSYGTISTATIPPSPSGTVATPLGTTQSDPSTSRLKWYTPRPSPKLPSQMSPPRARNGAGCQAFQLPAIATVRASGIRNRTIRLSPRAWGTRGAHRRTAATRGARGDLWNRSAQVIKPARGSPW